MNFVVARVTGRKKDEKGYHKILSEVTLFGKQENLVNAICYDPNTLLADGEWYSVVGFSETEYRIDIISRIIPKSSRFATLKSSLFDKIDFICSFQDEMMCFQNVTKNQLICRKAITIGDTHKLVCDQKSIMVQNVPDAIYDPCTDTLFFQKLSAITSIFKNIIQLHRDATEQETERFLGQPFILLENEFSMVNVKTANRKRIALVLEEMKKYDECEMKSIISYVCEYLPGLASEEERIRIGSEKDLQMLLYGLQQRFYTTPVSNDKLLANSVIKL